MDKLTTLSAALTILSAMIAPVVLISACASLTLSTSNRLARATERTRKLLERFEHLARTTIVDESAEEESMMLYDELLLATRRSRLLQRALASLYVAMSIFIATSVMLAFVAIVNEQYAWIALILMMVGAGFLFYTSILLIAEVYLQRKAINIEMDFVLRRTERYASPALQDYQQKRKGELDNTQPDAM